VAPSGRAAGYGVTPLGGGVDEAPQAYKDIDSVIAARADLVGVLGTFTPGIVRMADEPGDVQESGSIPPPSVGERGNRAEVASGQPPQPV